MKTEASLRLILMRHAKSAWDDPSLRDHDRRLNERGRLAAALMGAWLRDAGLTPDFALVSSAARTQETWALMGLEAPMETRPALYEADAATILSVIRGAPGGGTLMILGHQPGMQDAANRLLSDEMIAEYPTAKAAVIGFDAAGWAGVGFSAGRLIAAQAPKALV
ncbi:MAG: histidine phosphatase family protein [Paracoccaceae bacterium]